MATISDAAVFWWVPAALGGLMFQESVCKPVDRILTELFFSMVEISGAAVFCWLPAASGGLMF